MSITGWWDPASEHEHIYWPNMAEQMLVHGMLYVLST